MLVPRFREFRPQPHSTQYTPKQKYTKPMSISTVKMKDFMQLTLLMPANAAKYYTDLQLELLDTRDTAAATE